MGALMENSQAIKLSTFRVQTYRNFLDSQDVEVDDEATVLVGKNEAGKSTLLEALWQLNPANEVRKPFDFTLDYPRWLKKEHEDKKIAAQLAPVTATFTIGDAVRDELEATFGIGVLAAPAFTAVRPYDSDLSVVVDVNATAWVQAFAADHPDIFPSPETLNSADDLRAALDQMDQEITAAEGDTTEEGGEAAEAEATAALRAAHTAALGAFEAATNTPLDAQVGAFLKERVPRFFYFDDVFLLPGSVSIGRITNATTNGDESGLTNEEVAAVRFLRSVRLSPTNLDPSNFEALRAELEAVGNLLTDRVQQFWHQNPHLEFRVETEDVEGVDDRRQKVIVDRLLHFRVNDRRHRVTTSFTTRSTGFRWFVSFLAQFSYYAEGKHDVIVLLDEPGVSLHAKAQSDLLGYIDDQLVPNQQVLYTTHSAWMVPVRKIHRVRTVEEDLADEISTGARVSGKMLAKDRDTLMPLQAALGYDVAQSLFIGPDSLVVEGISEVLYLYDMSDFLRLAGRTALDDRWHICPAGSVGRIPAMLGLLGNSVDTTVLIDSPANASEKGNIEERLYEATRLIEVGTIIGAPEGDIEDLINPADYLAAFNACFGTNYVAADVTSQAPRITKRLEELHGKFNHGDVARAWVRERAAGTLVPSEPTTKAFEALFTTINATLTADAAPQAQNPALKMLDQQLNEGLITPEDHARYAAQLAT